MEGRTTCGLCGASTLYKSDNVTQLGSKSTFQQPTIQSNNNKIRGLVILTVTVAVLVGGIALVLLPISSDLVALGLFMIMGGGIALFVLSGILSGTPYRSRVLNRTDKWLKDRERRKYKD